MKPPAEIVVFASAARTATATSNTFRNDYGYRGLLLTLDVTAASGTSPTLALSIQAYDPVSGNWEKLLEGAAVSTTGTHTYFLYPGGDATAAEDVVEAQPFALPYRWRVVATIGGTTPSFTFSVGGCMLP